MKKYIVGFILIFGIIFFGASALNESFAFSSEVASDLLAQADQTLDTVGEASVELSPDGDHAEAHHSAPAWLVIPFITLLLMIATGPLFYEHFWHHNYPKVAVGFAALSTALGELLL